MPSAHLWSAVGYSRDARAAGRASLALLAPPFYGSDLEEKEKGSDLDLVVIVNINCNVFNFIVLCAHGCAALQPLHQIHIGLVRPVA